MFNDRDLAVIGGGALLAVFCLLLPASFAWKISLGIATLVLSMVAALLRLGGDRLTFEEWLRRRIRYALRPRTWTFHERRLDPPVPQKQPRPGKSRKPQAVHPAPQEQHSPRVVWIDYQTIGVEKLAGVLLVLVGVYILYALWSGEAADLAAFLQRFLQ